MESIRVNVAHDCGYKVLVGAGLLADSGQILLQSLPAAGRVVVVTDSTVEPLYAVTVLQSLAAAGFAPSVFTFGAGEQSKTMQTLASMLEFMAGEQLTRADCVVALGGGVVGDLAGFAAGCYMRGIRYVQVPTTLLAAVDASIGGKTGLDLSAGKNLAGLFWQPAAVICDTDCLASLPQEILLDGLVEAIKVGILGDEMLFSVIEGSTAADSLRANLEAIILRSVAFKAALVEADERESHLRKSLNLGHTIGHAIEACSGYTISHGQAVATGMAMITRAAVALDCCAAEAAGRIEQLLACLGFLLETGFSTEDLTQAALHDKKRLGRRMTLVLPREIGSYQFKEIDIDELGAVIDLGRGELL